MKTTVAILLMVVIIVTGCMAMQEQAEVVMPTASPMATLAPTATVLPTTQVSAPEKSIEVFTYRLDARGQRVYKSQGMTVAGDLVKTGNCVDGWAQVEYRTEPVERPGYWRVGWAKCEVVYGE